MLSRLRQLLRLPWLCRLLPRSGIRIGTWLCLRLAIHELSCWWSTRCLRACGGLFDVVESMSVLLPSRRVGCACAESHLTHVLGEVLCAIMLLLVLVLVLLLLLLLLLVVLLLLLLIGRLCPRVLAVVAHVGRWLRRGLLREVAAWDDGGRRWSWVVRGGRRCSWVVCGGRRCSSVVCGGRRWSSVVRGGRRRYGRRESRGGSVGSRTLVGGSTEWRDIW